MFTSNLSCSTVLRASAILAMLLDILHLSAASYFQPTRHSTHKKALARFTKVKEKKKYCIYKHGHTFEVRTRQTRSMTVY